MASAQVLRKQGHLEAGKKKLEEFRRKKAAEKAKKVVSTFQDHVSDGILQEKHPSEEKLVVLTDSNGVGTFDGLPENLLEPPDVYSNKIQAHDIAHSSDFFSSRVSNTELSFLDINNDNSSSVLEHAYMDNASYAGSEKPGHSNFKSSNEMDNNGLCTKVAPGIEDYLLAHHISNQDILRASNHSSEKGLEDYGSNHSNNSEKDPLLCNSGASSVFTSKFVPSALLQDKFDNSGQQGTIHRHSPYKGKIAESRETKLNVSTAHTGAVDHSSRSASDNMYGGYNSNSQSLSNHSPISPPTSGRRSRPSFLDSIQISNGPSSSPPLFGGSQADMAGSKAYPMDSLVSFVSQKFVNSSNASGDGTDLFSMENKHDLYSRKQNEDFAALEQHIEDLTQEKFSLQRALETSRALTESLASENSTLTDSFNQQGNIVSQLKFDLEKLQEEINAQLVELEAVKIDYVNAQMECNAADERAKLLAAEVIGLEEKALRLRSNELKLERQLENSQAEAFFCRKKMFSLEKDQQDLLSTIKALQEEKKLLQVKVWKASASGISVDADKIANNKKDASTSTQDLDIDVTTQTNSMNNYATDLLQDDAYASQFPHENILPSLNGLPLAIPADQMGVIQNISALISELALEKDQLLKDLSAESFQISKLMELNNELSRKLESQTQRLELLMSQSMEKDNNQKRRPDTQAVHENIIYADEGDEVVERVLGWIMKLFPGGPSKRRPSKHL